MDKVPTRKQCNPDQGFPTVANFVGEGGEGKCSENSPVLTRSLCWLLGKLVRLENQFRRHVNHV